MVQIFLETSGNALNSTSESIRLLKKLLNWKNSFTGSSKKIDEDISFSQRQKMPCPRIIWTRQNELLQVSSAGHKV